MFKIDSGKQSFQIEPHTTNPAAGTLNGEDYELDIAEQSDDRLHVLYKGKSYNIEILESDRKAKKFVLSVNGKVHALVVQDEMDLLLDRLGVKSALNQKVSEFKAPMPGLVLDIRVEEGREISEGDPLIVLEAMKMENVLKSPASGTIRHIAVNRGQTVEKNQILMRIKGWI